MEIYFKSGIYKHFDSLIIIYKNILLYAKIIQLSLKVLPKVIHIWGKSITGSKNKGWFQKIYTILEPKLEPET